MHTNSDEKVFYMKNHLLEKLHPNSTRSPVEDFQNPQKPNRTKDTGLLRSRGGKMKKKFKLTSGAPFASCATSNRKKIGFEFFFWKKYSKYDT